MSVRIIPRLDIKGSNLVKGIHLEGLRALGPPEFFARRYYEAGADELLYMDAVASLYGRNSLLEMVERTASEIFIPLCVGGGIRSVDDIRTILRAGADKVYVNSAALARPELIREAAETFGSSTIVVGVEAMRRELGVHECFSDNGRQPTGRKAVDWAKDAACLGAGELIVLSIDQEGTGLGFDMELVRSVSEAVSIPVIACGGAGRPEHIAQVVQEGKADAVSLASMLHYNVMRTQDVPLPENYGIGQIADGRNVEQQFEFVNLKELKTFLVSKEVNIRYDATPVKH